MTVGVALIMLLLLLVRVRRQIGVGAGSIGPRVILDDCSPINSDSKTFFRLTLIITSYRDRLRPNCSGKMVPNTFAVRKTQSRTQKKLFREILGLSL